MLYLSTLLKAKIILLKELFPQLFTFEVNAFIIILHSWGVFPFPFHNFFPAAAASSQVRRRRRRRRRAPRVGARVGEPVGAHHRVRRVGAPGAELVPGGKGNKIEIKKIFKTIVFVKFYFFSFKKH